MRIKIEIKNKLEDKYNFLIERWIWYEPGEYKNP
jgi:hypothetical protein